MGGQASKVRQAKKACEISRESTVGASVTSISINTKREYDKDCVAKYLKK